jgi:hypothetical protein
MPVLLAALATPTQAATLRSFTQILIKGQRVKGKRAGKGMGGLRERFLPRKGERA